VATLEIKYKAFHFQEIGWIINFPVAGNVGKYADYDIELVDGKNEESTKEKRLKLQVVLSMPEVEQNYPHTVGYFKVSWGEAADSKQEYLELREIRTVEEFWAFLNAVNL
jgi:hypothetical protein